MWEFNRIAFFERIEILIYTTRIRRVYVLINIKRYRNKNF